MPDGDRDSRKPLSTSVVHNEPPASLSTRLTRTLARRLGGVETVIAAAWALSPWAHLSELRNLVRSRKPEWYGMR